MKSHKPLTQLSGMTQKKLKNTLKKLKKKNTGPMLSPVWNQV